MPNIIKLSEFFELQSDKLCAIVRYIHLHAFTPQIQAILSFSNCNSFQPLSMFLTQILWAFQIHLAYGVKVRPHAIILAQG